MIYIYLFFLIIQPQLWISPFLGIPVDLILYPIWLATIILKGKANKLFTLNDRERVFVAMFLWIVLSVIINQKNQLSYKIIVDYSKFFILYKFVVAELDEVKKLRSAINWMVFLVFILVIESIQHKLSPTGLGWAGQPLGWADEAIIHATGAGRTKWVSIFDGPGVFCVLFVISLPFVLRGFDPIASTSRKILATLASVPLGIAIYFTGSRGGFLAALVVIFGYLLFRGKITLKRSIASLVLVLMLFTAAPAFLTSTSDSHGSAQNRVDMWAEGLEMTKYNPIFGVGKANYLGYTGKLIAHNSAIEVMGETGLPGLFFWLSLIVLSFQEIWNFHLVVEDEKNRSLARAIGLSIIGYIIASMFVTLEYETFYFLLALAACFATYRKESTPFSGKTFKLTVGIMIGWIMILKMFLLLY